MKKKIFLIHPRGFCAGVRRALDTVNRVLELYKAPVYVFHEIVHNDYVVESLIDRGVVFVEQLAEIPVGAPLIFSAHGVPVKMEQEAVERGLNVIDATCPLVKRIHKKAISYEQKGFSIILIGHRHHPEIIGTAGQLQDSSLIIESPSDVASMQIPGPDKIVYLTQTTWCVDDIEQIVRALKQRFPEIAGGGDICYATQNRQQAVKVLAGHCDVVFVLGSPKSSNSNRLREAAEKCGTAAYLLNSVADITGEMLAGRTAVGVTAAASAPEILVQELIGYLHTLNWKGPEHLVGEKEKIIFPLPEIQESSEP